MTDTFDSFEKDKQQLRNKYDNLITTVEGMGLGAVHENLCLWRKKLDEDRFLVLVFGDFSRGKSTLINALLGKKLLPSKETPTTGAINIIKYGADQKAFVYFKDNPTMPKEVSFNEFRQLVTITKNGDDEAGSPLSYIKNPIEQIELYCDVALCKNGVEIVDSPGLNDRQSDTKLTYGFLPKSDAAIVVLSAEALLTASEIENIRSLVNSGYKNLLFVVNFWDLVNQDADDDEDVTNNEGAELMRRAESLLLPIMGKEPLRIFYLSARKALNAKIKCDQPVLVSSGFHGFESNLSDFLIRGRGQAFLKQANSNWKTQALAIESAIETKEHLVYQPLEELQRLQDSIQPQLNDLKQKKENILSKVRSVAERVTRNQTDKFETMLDRLTNSGLKNEAGNWKSDQTVLLLPGQVRRCGEDFIVLGERFIHKKIVEWVDKECGPELEQEIKNLDREIKDEAKAFEHDIKQIQTAIRPDFGPVDCEPKDSVGVIERLLTTGGLWLFSPVAAITGGVLGAKAAIVNLGSNIGAGLLLATLGVLSFPTFLVAGILIGLVQVILNVKEKQPKIRDSVVNRYIEVLSQKSREMSRQLESSLRNFFDELQNNLENGFNSEIDGVSQQLNQIIADKSAAKHSVDETLREYSKHKKAVRRMITEQPSLAA
jgi:GTPase SAR1 family protein